MSGHWATQRERGSVLGMKLLMRFTRLFGRGAALALLYPVSFYYLLFARRATHALREYLAQVFGRPPTWVELFRHYYSFAVTLLDRALLLSGQAPQLDFSSEDAEVVRRLTQRERGCLLLGAHLGSFDVARILGEVHRHTDIHMMMYEENARKINAVFESIGAKSRMSVIPIGGVNALLQVQERLDRGEWVGILGDRLVTSERVVTVPFFGRPAVFPAGPFLMASTLKVPVVLFASLYHGGNRYKEYFELFAEEITLDRRHRDADLEKWVRRYAERLEHYCRLAPYNWFNFYDFWEAAPQLAPALQAAAPAKPVLSDPIHKAMR
jgi:predicted LPLAT superfamily acyltransferase